MSIFTSRILFLLFFVSGFCSLTYQVIWTRIAFAAFGITTPVFSVVLSVFMFGLSFGAWSGGRSAVRLAQKTNLSGATFYSGAELLIGLGAFAVPMLISAGEHFLLAAGQTNSINYLCLSALVLAFSILPWCVCMGATFPLMMAYVRELDSNNAESFSRLYLANVLGAMSGALLTSVVLVELMGFRHTLWIAATGNFSVAIVSGWLGWRQRSALAILHSVNFQPTWPGKIAAPGYSRSLLFSTGFCAMAMEVVWTRAFTPVLNNQVYSFALVVFVYLAATFFGSMLYRLDLKKKTLRSIVELISMLIVSIFIPIIASDPRLVETDRVMDLTSVTIVLGSIFPFCAILGYLTPRLIDDYALGNPTVAGKAYAINGLGCILGPVFACYVLMPLLSERHALIVLGTPFLALYLLSFKSQSMKQRMSTGLTAGASAIYALFFSEDFEGLISKLPTKVEIRRDYAASVISAGDGQRKGLFVNGINMTLLTSITKFMVHLPLAFHKGQPDSALIICFGMGTSYRSALSWDIETTAVELVPSVREAFGFYHADAASVLANPKGDIIIDDGRRYLKRTREKYDVIVVDPPPPVEAAGSSLLYSTEFYELAKQHLKPNGILAAWFPHGELATAQAVIRSVCDCFAYVHCFKSVEGWGIHILASMEPFEMLNAADLAARMPKDAKEDLLEWSTSSKALPFYLERVLSSEFLVTELCDSNSTSRITDDRPFNEYFLLRRLGALP